jgi:RNA polymerase sigma factor (TIGR02999 family)
VVAVKPGPIPAAPAGVTGLLRRWNSGDRHAFDEATSLVYDELKRLAHSRLRDERPGHTLNTTGLVHEAYLRLADIQRAEWNDRNHFLSMASRIMRRILVDHARRRNAAKRGGGSDVTLEEHHLLVTAEKADRVLELDRAVHLLEEAHPRPGRVVELYYFGGLPQVEVAEVLGVSQPTVARDLRFALAWLGREWAGP